MSYPLNYQYKNLTPNGGVYNDPTAVGDSLVLQGIANYAPVNPGYVNGAEYYNNQYISQTPGYNPNNRGAVSHLNVMSKAAVAQVFNDANVTLDPAASTIEKQNSSSALRDAIA